MTIDIDGIIEVGSGATSQNGAAAEDTGILASWSLRTLKNAYEVREPTRFLIDKVLPLPSLWIAYGGPGSLKSMLLADMAVSIASGQKWLDHMPAGKTNGVSYATLQSPVLWLDFDNGRRQTDARFDALAKARNIPENAPVYYVSMPSPWFNATKADMVSALRDKMLSLSIKLTVIDNLGLITGDAEENSAEMADVMGNLRWLCEETESSIGVIHHQRKSSTQSGGADVRKGDNLRGHSSIEASLDLALWVLRKDGEDNIAAIPTKVRGYRSFEKIEALFTYEHRPGSYDMATARFWSYSTVTKEDRHKSIILEIALQEIKAAAGREETLNKTGLATQIRAQMEVLGMPKIGINPIRKYLQILEDEGRLLSVEGAASKQERIYVAPHTGY